MGAESTKKGEVIYVGQRRFGLDSISHCFKFGEQERFWENAKYCIIGHRYEVTMEPPEEGKPDGTLRMSHMPNDLGKADVDEDTLEEWRLQDKLAKDFAARKRAWNAQEKKAPDLVKYTQELRRMYCKLRSQQERESFENILIKVIRGYYE